MDNTGDYNVFKISDLELWDWYNNRLEWRLIRWKDTSNNPYKDWNSNKEVTVDLTNTDYFNP